ncbi:MAG: hypothetical protein QG574_5266 [Cyanobacteriota bacterium erpe_2018_sw_21hr_WHONDRS-SW48-000092_B_bin.40]|nr:hypothetical protein [Cyanobacteriota bacterium erpe_2018_sw_21hr_WHONDRS-SW48-000092_B_bin.40]
MRLFNQITRVLAAVALAAGLGLSTLEAQSKAPTAFQGKVLVVLSSAKALTLKDGVQHATGFYMNELGVPLQALIKAGFEPVYVNPQGNQPAMDVSSDKPALFASAAEYNAVKELLKNPKLAHPQKLSAIAAGDLNQYVGIFVPGGHAPMEDLWKDASLGKILRHFHSKNQPTALICHGPIALLSTLNKPEELGKALEASHSASDKDTKKTAAEKPVTSKELWTYQGYRMTVFSDAEEKPNEPTALGGYMKFYPEDALRAAGAKLQIAPAKKSKVVQDRELITGQNPFSDKELAAAFLKALKFKGEVK